MTPSVHPLRLARPLAACLLAAGTLAAVACDADRLVVPNQNSATPQGASADVAAAVNQLAGGIQGLVRDQAGNYVVSVGILGREAYNYTGTESRNTSGFLVNPDDGTSFGGGAIFANRYVNLRNIFLFNQQVEAGPFTDAQKNAARGFAKTFEALELHYVIARNDALGASVEVYDKPDSIAPFVTRDSVYSRIVNRLNDGVTNLRAGGAAFPFTMGTGYAGFNTPATFVRFNRAIAARVQAYRGSLGCGASCYQQALTALGESFLDPAGALTTGVYNTFSTASGETTNSATSFGGQARVIVAYPTTRAEAPARADGSLDLRAAAKTTVFSAAAGPVNPSFCTTSNLCVPTNVGFTRYPDQTTPIPIIKNEELILLRAEARYFTGDVPGAVSDLNVVRTTSGGLAPITAANVATPDAFVTELLQQRRYSLLLEGHRWIDVRRFGRLNTLPLDKPNHKVVANLAIPQQECLSRGRTGSAALKAPTCPGQ